MTTTEAAAPQLPEPALLVECAQGFVNGYTAAQMLSFRAAGVAGALAEHAAEVEAWKAFARHCQRLVGLIKSRMTAVQVVEWLDSQMAEKIERLNNQDSSDLDPELLAMVREWGATMKEGPEGPSHTAPSQARANRANPSLAEASHTAPELALPNPNAKSTGEC